MLSSNKLFSFVIYVIYLLDVKSISLEIFFLINIDIICLYNEVCESKIFLDNFCFKFSCSISKLVLHILTTLSSIGYLVDKTLNPFGKLFFVIFLSLNKGESKIFSRLYLDSIFGSNIFLKNS